MCLKLPFSGGQGSIIHIYMNKEAVLKFCMIVRGIKITIRKTFATL